MEYVADFAAAQPKVEKCLSLLAGSTTARVLKQAHPSQVLTTCTNKQDVLAQGWISLLFVY